MFSTENVVYLQMKINKFNNKRLLSIPLHPEGWSFLERFSMNLSKKNGTVNNPESYRRILSMKLLQGILEWETLQVKQFIKLIGWILKTYIGKLDGKSNMISRALTSFTNHFLYLKKNSSNKSIEYGKFYKRVLS